mmetsp:Transcript_39760/g.71371  ORF Transcript_39760/g.71371 Transcript_39760/m.71371 type:complete len:209 (+) Transcript_39760:122-748(+)
MGRVVGSVVRGEAAQRGRHVVVTESERVSDAHHRPCLLFLHLFCLLLARRGLPDGIAVGGAEEAALDGERLHQDGHATDDRPAALQSLLRARQQPLRARVRPHAREQAHDALVHLESRVRHRAVHRLLRLRQGEGRTPLARTTWRRRGSARSQRRQAVQHVGALVRGTRKGAVGARRSAVGREGARDEHLLRNQAVAPCQLTPNRALG